ncbi:N-6 DNA methylase [Candidatus Woesebacteria bacterium]|nr:N-6 DNA methylase [Candidatus Woesebacteria bacterium]
MNLFNKKLLSQHLTRYEFPSGLELEEIQRILSGWQKALKDSNLDRTKETGIQGQFLTKFFETVLGYDTQTSGKEQWHLNQEPKTEVDAQEADGALGFFTKDSSKVWAVIELKDAKTSLDKKQSGRIGKLTPVEQAFQYLNKFDGCKWAIVSNFREIRIYSKSRGQGFYEKFDIVDLTQEHEFKRFYYVLNRHNLIDEGHTSVIDHLVADTTAQEENITKKFYEHYKEIRLKVLNHLFEHNPEIDRLLLVEKTQKLLDRLIFTMVCEDSSTLLPAHLVKNTYDRAFQSFALSDSDERVWTEFKGLFHAIDKGNKRVLPPINAYNGGLFKADDVLDNLFIKDSIWEELIKLTIYDFESDLNVNVLGHIFEQSISDLEEIKASVEGESVDKKKSLRKKQGIFYTPEYITKYIVENTVGKYLEENPDKLESIKILDPACGSGAFLNQAHSYLLSQYKIRDEEKRLELQKQGKATGLFDLKWVENDKSILLNNLFGVDLSPESVEITKLALWLKTAKATEPLQNLDSNVKCGNSLVDDPEIAGIRSFNWKTEFQDVMREGGFDVIIGNPPYVNSKMIPKQERDFFWKKYPQYLQMDLDLYQIFFIKSILELLKDNGWFGFITPNSYFTGKSFELLRKLLIDTTIITNIVDFPYRFFPFENANTETAIIIFKKAKSEKQDTPLVNSAIKLEVGITPLNEHNPNEVTIPLLKNDNTFVLNASAITQRILKNENIIDFNDHFTLSNPSSLDRKERYPSTTKYDYDSCIFSEEELVFDPELRKICHLAIEGNNILKYLLHGEKKYTNIVSADGKKINDKTLSLMRRNKIVAQRITGQAKWRLVATLDQSGLISMPSVNVIVSKNDDVNALKCLLAFHNSRLCNYLYKQIFGESNTNITSQVYDSLPIVKTLISNKQLPELVDELIDAKRKLFNIDQESFENISSSYKICSNQKLSHMSRIGFNELVDELNKQGINFEVDQIEKLRTWFKKRQKETSFLVNLISEKEMNIENIVFNMYDLSLEDRRAILDED